MGWFFQNDGLGAGGVRARRALRSGLSGICLPLLLLSLRTLPALAAEPAPEARFAAAFELELQGRFTEAFAEYQALMGVSRFDATGLSGRLLYRMAVCEKHSGRPDEARRLWQDLLRGLPPEHPMAPRVREAVKQLERESERVRVRARIVAASAGAVPPAPVPRAWVLVGEWGNEPPVLADGEGRIRVDRRGAGQLSDGRPYVLVFAEHPEKTQAAVVVVADDREEDAGDVQLKATFAMTGRVKTRDGMPVEGARIRVLGLLGAGSRGGGPVEWVPVPFDHLMPPVYSGSNGVFASTGLIPGVRYTLIAEKEGFILTKALVLDAGPVAEGGVASWVHSGDILLRPEEQIAIRGRVWDEAGAVTGALVSAWSLPPVVRSLVATNTDAGGFFAFPELRENLVTIRVDAGGRGRTELPGIKPMGQSVDLILERNAGAEDGGGSVAVRQEGPPDASLNPMAWAGAVPWLRGMAPNGETPRAEDWQGKVVVLRFSSAYVEASLRRQYPGENSLLARLDEEWRSRGVMCAWILPQADAGEGGKALALEADGEYPVALDLKGEIWPLFHLLPQGGYVVLDRGGRAWAAGDGARVFRLLKQVTGM